MLLVVGLGNPGPEYAKNRHNIGFMAVDAIAQRYGFAAWRSKFAGMLSEGTVAGEKVLALKPQTYVNDSGRAVGQAVNFFKLDPADVLVLYDELDLAPGKVRVKVGGGAGGHNGIRSIDSHIGPAYRRVRLGIGHPGDKDRVTGHVLSDFAKADRDWVEKLTDAVAEHLPLLIKGDDAGFMSQVALSLNPPKPRAPRASAPEPTEPSEGKA